MTLRTWWWTPLFNPGTESSWGDRCPHAWHQKLWTWDTFYLTSLATELWDILFFFFPTFFPPPSSCTVVCISENNPQFSLWRYYPGVALEKELAIRTRRFQKGPFCHVWEHLSVSTFQGALILRLSWGLQENREARSPEQPHVGLASCDPESVNCWRVIWNFCPAADKGLFPSLKTTQVTGFPPFHPDSLKQMQRYSF